MDTPTRAHLALDLGASSGRAVLGLFDESLHTDSPENPNTLEVIKLKDRLSGGADPFASVKLRFEPTGGLRDYSTEQEVYFGNTY